MTKALALPADCAARLAVSVDYVSTIASHDVPPPQTSTTSYSADGGIGSLVIVPGSQGNGPFLVSVASSVGYPLEQCGIHRRRAARCLLQELVDLFLCHGNTRPDPCLERIAVIPSLRVL